MADRPVLYLIDGHAVAYRQFHAFNHIPGERFVTGAGEPTGATFGFTRVLLDILETAKPKYLAVSFDRGLSGRDTVYEDYKATRDKMPDELAIQLERIQQIVEAFNIPVLALDGYEADDVIGTISRQAVEQNIDVFIITGDKDILQLLRPEVRVELPSRSRKPDKIYDEAAFAEAYGGLRPPQLIDLKALMGDSSDNIPGVYRVGEKTGIRLLKKYGNLDNIYANLEEIKGATKRYLTNDRDMAFLSRDLVTIKTDLPITLSLDACLARDYDPLVVDAIFEEVEFTRMRERLRSMHPAVRFIPPVKPHVVIVDTPKKLTELTRILAQTDVVVFDVETDSLDHMQANLVGIALAVDEKTGYYVPVGHKKPGDIPMFPESAGKQLPLDTVLDALRPILTDANIPKVAHNASFDLMIMARYGMAVHPIGFDTMVAEWVCNPVSNNLSLKRFALNELEVGMQEISDLIGKGKNAITMDLVPIEDAAPYAAADGVVTFMAMQHLKKKLVSHAVEELYHDLELPIIPVIVAMQRAGAKLDVDLLQQMSQKLQEQLEALEADIHELGGAGEFNVNSPKQLNEILFETLKLPVRDLKKTSLGYSTDINTLEILKDEHAIIPKIMEHRELSKLKGTYIDALPALVNPETGRIHTSYNQTGTSTGRFSSSDPNLQNIPIRTEPGREIRRAFVAQEGFKLLGVDYSQIELRVLAHISKDATLIKAFEAGEDIHRATAATVYDVAPDDVTYEMRSFAKRVNFGLIYGMGAHRLAQDSDLTYAEASQFIKTYFERLPGVEAYIKKTEAFVRKEGYVETLLKRKRYFPRLQTNSSGGGRQEAADLRAAINMPIQGTAADILKQAMIDLHRELTERDSSARMILQVHDELVLEVPEADLTDITALVVDVMQKAYPLRVPLVANASTGSNWLEMEPVE